MIAVPVFDHLIRLTGKHGLFEHALYDEPRVSHGYTTDDNARALVVAARVSGTDLPSVAIEPYLNFVLSAEVPGGWHNRMTQAGEWADQRGPDDTHGRALWGLGELAASGIEDVAVLDALLAGAMTFDSTYPRAVSYAVFGAASLLSAGVLVDVMEDFLSNASARLARPGPGDWMWPEPRLTYDNARLPEALITAGNVLGDDAMADSGIRLLSWLLETESGDHGFSFTPANGRGPGDTKPAFDQQPLEAWAMADACFAAMKMQPDAGWHEPLMDAAEWFLGKNDAGLELYDRATGAGFDGLESEDVNQNRGAESTLSALGTLIRWMQTSQRDGVS